MKRKQVVVAVLSALLALQAALAFAQSQVIYEVIAADELIDVDLEIPENVAPGYHQMLVEVLDDNGVVRSKVALFCKDTDGTVSLDNVCPGLVAAGIEAIEEVVVPDRAGYGDPFDPRESSGQTQGLLVTLFALATVLLTNQRQDEKSHGGEEESNDDRGSLETVSAGALAIRRVAIGRGDRRRLRKSSHIFDSVGVELAGWANKVSYILARVILDGRYLRAMFGSSSWLLTVLGAFLSWQGVNEINREALPLNFFWLAGIMALGILDAFAGFYASLAYFLAILFAGNLSSFSSYVTVFGTMLVMYAPALIASTFRPLQRTVRSKKDLWERLTDYSVGILLSAMAVNGLVSSLSGLSGVKLKVADQSAQFAAIAAVMLFIRILLEERAWYQFPQALRSETIAISNGSKWRTLTKSVLRLLLFVAFALPLVGPTTGFLLGVAIFVTGQIVSQLELSIPKSRLIGQLIPSGVPSIVLVAVLGGFVSFWLTQSVTNPGHLIEATFWVMALPGLIISILNKAKGAPFIELKNSPTLRMSYVLLGMVAYALLVATAFGVDLSESLRSIF